MPRTARVLVDNGYYHVITRGIDCRRLFHTKQDYSYFRRVLKEYREKYNVGIVHYCLMPNHIHLLVRVEKAGELPKFMQGMLQVYASSFRKKYASAGFIFQNRYKSNFIQNDAYLLECGRYIERNPLRAQLVKCLDEYLWSSFPFYAKGASDDIINNINPLFIHFSQDEQERRKCYSEYLLRDRFYDHIVDKEFKIRQGVPLGNVPGDVPGD